MVKCKIEVRQSLRFHTLRSINYKDCAIAGCKRSADFIIEVDMTGRINQVEDVLLAILRLVYCSDSLSLDRYASLTLKIHVVEHLILHLALCKETGHLDDTICQR